MKHQQLYLKVLFWLVVAATTVVAWEQLVTAKPRTKAAKKAQENYQQIVKNYAHFMKRAPRLSFAIHRRATIDCHLDEQLAGADYHLAWLKLNKSTVTTTYFNNQLVISSNERVVLPDQRYKILRQNDTWWRLTIDDLRESDGEAYYLCQTNIDLTDSNSDIIANASSKASIEHMFAFQRGARLRVLTPPRIIEQETSASPVIANEYEEAVLRCTVYSSNISSFAWFRREQSNVSENAEPMKGSQIKKSPENPTMNVWHEFSQIKFSPFLREHAGVYFCYVTNNIAPGISRRFELIAVNCRVLNSTDSPSEPCSAPRYVPGQMSQVDEPINESSTEQPIDQAESPHRASTGHHGWKTRPATRKDETDVTTTTEVGQHLDQQEGDEPSIAFVLVSNSSSTPRDIPLWLLSIVLLITMLMYHK